MSNKSQTAGRSSAVQPVTSTGALAALRWALTRRASRWPRNVAQEVLTRVPERGDPGAVSWVLVGHSTVFLQVGAFNLLIDPIWSARCSPFSWAGPRRVRRPALAFEALPPIDAVLVSHNHYDHCDRATLERLSRLHEPQFLVGRGVATALERWGIRRVDELDWWSSFDLDSPRAEPSRGQLAIQFVPAQHFSARGLHDRDKTLWGGFWIGEIKTEAGAERPRGSDKAIYFCGDTGFNEPLFRELNERNGAPDLAFLPIGAYDPRWFMAPVHVNPEEAVEAHKILGSRHSVGMHCATFQLTDEPINEPVERLKRAASALRETEGRFTPPKFGVLETLEW